MIKIAIILGSTRPGRNGEAVAKWVDTVAAQRTDAQFEFIDLKDLDLPLLDEPLSPSLGKYTKSHTKSWAAKVKGFDAFVFVTPEYNHGTSGALKNALDFLYKEWNNKAAGFVAYGTANGTRAVEQLRLVLAELQVATVRAQVGFSLFTDFKDYTVFKPADVAAKQKELNTMLDQLVAWGEAMVTVRARLAKVELPVSAAVQVASKKPRATYDPTSDTRVPTKGRTSFDREARTGTGAAAKGVHARMVTQRKNGRG